MTIPRTLLVAICTLAMTFAWPTPSRADAKCPLVIEFAELRATGTAHKSNEYVVGLRSQDNAPLDQTYSVNFSAGVDPKAAPTVTFSIAGLAFDPSGLGYGVAAIVAIFNTPAIRWMKVDSEQGGSWAVVNCSADPPFTLEGDLLKAAATFDDGHVDAGGAPIVARLDGLVIMNKVFPDYPEAAQDSGIQGDVVTMFTVHGDGSTSDYGIYKSSGDSDLDTESLRAARLTTVSPARLPASLGGSAIDVKFLIEYTFRLDKY